MSDVLLAFHCPPCEAGEGGIAIGAPVPICWLCGTRMLPGSILTKLRRKVRDEEGVRTEWEALMEAMEVI